MSLVRQISLPLNLILSLILSLHLMSVRLNIMLASNQRVSILISQASSDVMNNITDIVMIPGIKRIKRNLYSCIHACDECLKCYVSTLSSEWRASAVCTLIFGSALSLPFP